MLFNALIWLLCGALNFYRAARVQENGAAVLLGILFTIIGIIWLVRYIRKRKEDRNE